jgi:hypothetical protein
MHPFEDVSKVRTGRFLCRGCREESDEDRHVTEEIAVSDEETDETPRKGRKRDDDADDEDEDDEDDEDDGEEDEYEEDDYEEDDDDDDGEDDRDGERDDE